MNSPDPHPSNRPPPVPADGRGATGGSDRFPGSLLFLFLLLAGGVAGTGWAVLARQQTEARQASHTALTAIADLKVAQITAWLNERLSDARFFARADVVARDVATFLADPASPESRERTLDWLQLLQASERYQVVALFDAQLEERLTAAPWPHSPGPELRELLAAARRTNDVWMTDFQQSGSGDAVHLDILVPLFPPDAGTGRTNSLPGAVLLLRLDPRKFLYPLAQSWPTPSRSAETLLVRRDGGNVLFLNELRHKTNTALRLRRPLTDSRLPAALAVQGELGLTEGVDYRGVPVVAAASVVPGTPWYMVAKMDEAELYAPLHRQARIVGATVTALLLAAALGVGLLWRHSRTVSLRLELASQRHRLALAERVGLLLRQANDIILLLDDRWRVVEANERALQAYGYSETELRQMTLRDLGVSESQSEFDTHLHRADISQGLIVEAVHRRKDGSSFPIEISVRSVQVEGQKHHQAIIRDITQRNTHLREIAKLNRLYATLSQVNQAIVRAPSRDAMLQAVCRVAIEYGQFRLAWIGLLEPATRAIRPVAQAGDAAGYVERLTMVADDGEEGRGLTGAAIRGDRPCVGNDLLNDPRMQPWKPLIEAKGFRSAVALPLHVGGTVTGALMLYAEEPGFFSEPELELLEEVTTDLSYGLDHLESEARRQQTEAALRKSEEKHRRLHETMVDAFVSVDMAGHILEFNRAYQEMLGYSAEEFRKLTYEDLTPPRWHDREADIVRSQILPHGFSGVYEKEYRRKDGTVFPVELRTSLLHDDAGHPVGMWAIVRDITDRRRAQEQLEESEDRYRILLNRSFDGIFVHQGFRIVQCNDRMAKIAGYDPSELLGARAIDLFTPDSRARIQGYIDAGEVGSYELKLRRRDGSLTQVESYGSPCKFQGREARIVALRDITERKRAERALKESEDLFRSLSASSPVGIFLADLRGHCSYANPRWRAILGLTLGESVGDGWLRALDPEDRDGLTAQWSECVRQHQDFSGEFRVRRPGGIERWVSVRAAIRDADPGESTGLVGTLEDITDRKQAEDALQRSGEQLRALAERLEAVREEERIRLAREVHDQVGQALTSLNLDVAWLGERLDKLGLTTAHRALAGRLEAMSNRLAQTVSTVQRISSDLRPGILDDLGLAAAIEWQADAFAARVGLTCEARCSPLSRDPDPKRSTALFRILQELLTNVVRHAQASRVDLELREHAGTVILEVRDNGQGLTEEQVRAAKSLGLLGVRERAQAVGGTVQFRGQPGQGTCVTVTVPLL